MGRRLVFMTLLLSLGFARVSAGAGECAAPDSKLKPVKVTGAFCGRAMWMGRSPDLRQSCACWTSMVRKEPLSEVMHKDDSRSGTYRVDVDEERFFDEIEISRFAGTALTRK
jgi:hypothetical protein